MKIFYLIFIIIVSFNVFAETYSCKYKQVNQIKKFNLDRITHSHFIKCIQNQCEDQKYSVIFADSNNLIIGDIVDNNENFFLFILDKKTNLFSGANIKLPNKDAENIFFKGKCLRY